MARLIFICCREALKFYWRHRTALKYITKIRHFDYILRFVSLQRRRCVRWRKLGQGPESGFLFVPSERGMGSGPRYTEPLKLIVDWNISVSLYWWLDLTFTALVETPRGIVLLGVWDL